MTIITDDRCTGYSTTGHPERPARLAKSVEKLRAQKDLNLTWAEPLSVTDDTILRAHSRAHLAKVTAAAG